MERVLVTGVTGFIGSEVARHLCESSYEVYGLVRHTSNKELAPIRDLMDRVEVRFGNLTDHLAVRKILEDVSPTYILHIGAYTPVRFSFDQPMEYQHTNYLATVNLVHSAMSLHSLRKFVFASTMETYGWQTGRRPFSEDLPLHPASPYAVSKAACDMYIRMAGKCYGFPHIVLRPCNTYGRKHNAGFITEYITTTMLKGETVYIGKPACVRDLLFVDDHVDGYIKAMESDVVGDVFNLGASSELTMMQLAEKLRKLTGFKGKIVTNYPPDYPRRPVECEPEYLSLNASKAKKLLRWQPAVTIDEGLERTVAYWKKHLGDK